MYISVPIFGISYDLFTRWSCLNSNGVAKILYEKVSMHQFKSSTMK